MKSKDKLKVLQLSKFYPPYKGGIEAVAETFSKAHRFNGAKVDIISFGEKNKDYLGQFSERIYQIKKDIFILSTPIAIFQTKRIFNIISKENYDIIYIHLPNPYMHFIAIFIKLFSRNSKIIGIYHSDIVNQKTLKGIYNFYFLKTSYIYEKLIVSSNNLWEFSPVLKNINTKKKSVIPFCLNSSIKFNKREKFNGNIVSVGRFVPYKGFDFLIKTISKTNYKLTIIGDGPEYNRLKSMASSNISLPGRLSEKDKNSIISKSDVFIMSSINNSEAYGMSLIEALQSGLPIIAPDLKTGVTYLCENETRGLTYSPCNENELITCLKKFEANDKVFSDYSKNARNFFESTLTFDSFQKNVYKLVSNL